MREYHRLAQQILNNRTNAGLDEDGIFGSKSQNAAKNWIPWNFRGIPSALRWSAAVIQKEGQLLGLETGPFDAFWGPQTQTTADQIQAALTNTPLPQRPDESEAFITQDHDVKCWYPTDKQMIDFYGPPGENQAMAHIAFPLRLDWDLSTTINRFQCHRKIQQSVEKVFEDVLQAYGLKDIQRLGIDRFGGCFNVRKKRGGSTWSAHSWGVAIDLYPSQNQLRWGRDKAAFARPEYAPLRSAFQAQGFMSLGACANFDWMHWQRNPQK